MNYRAIKEKLHRYRGERARLPDDKERFLGYTKVIDTQGYSVYLPPYMGENVVAAYGTTVVTQNARYKNRLIIYPYFQTRRMKYKVELSARAFPGLLPGSQILLCLLIPYMRTVRKNAYVKSLRLVLITDQGQIYHNYPNRAKDCDGVSLPGDVVKFEESAVWDLPGRKFPCKTLTDSQTERYYPNLPKICYEYHPMSNTESNFRDPYGNGGFGKQTTVTVDGSDVAVSRFYMPSRSASANPFFYMGRGDFDEKMCLIGTYRSNVEIGVRTCVFASSDGGREWFCKYEFADAGEYSFRQGDTEKWGRNFGSPIVNDGYDACCVTDFRLVRRFLNVPSENAPEPSERFIWQDIGEIACITDCRQLECKTKAPHGLQTGNIVVISGRSNDSKLDWMLNNDYSATSAGNGMLFKVEVMDEHTVRFYELVSNPNSNIPCRHIHHINRIKDGWLIGTGEIYPNGWLLYMQMREADTFSVKHARDHFEFFRLNSSQKSIQRTLGAILKDDSERTLMYASDHDTLEREAFSIEPGRTDRIMRSSTGVFKGLLGNIDDRDCFECVFEAKEPSFYFQQLDQMLIFGGQRGELGISFDEGSSWSREKIHVPIIRYRGSTLQYYYFDSCIIKRK